MTETENGAFNRLTEAMVHEGWKKHCRAARATFPAMTTYLAQFMAHDITLSAVQALDFSDLRIAGHRTRNLRTAPLRLETLYGHGQRESLHLFQSHGVNRAEPPVKFGLNQFRTLTTLPEKTVWAPAFTQEVTTDSRAPRLQDPAPFVASPVLGDPRNADQPMLMFIAVAFMRLHNLYVEAMGRGTAMQKFEAARILVTAAWHDIIRNDILEALAPDAQTRREAPILRLDPERVQGPDAIQGVMRALHVLPLDEYLLHRRASGHPTLHRLGPLLAPRAVNLEVGTPATKVSQTEALQGWWKVWGIDYEDFMSAAQNQTNVMPVVARALQDSQLLQKDRAAAGVHGVSAAEAYAPLLNGTEALYSKMTTVTGLGGFPAPAELPLWFVFLVEAYGAGTNRGGLGPVGYELLSKRIERQLDAAHLPASLSHLETEINHLQADRPKTFETLIEYLLQNERT